MLTTDFVVIVIASLYRLYTVLTYQLHVPCSVLCSHFTYFVFCIRQFYASYVLPFVDRLSQETEAEDINKNRSRNKDDYRLVGDADSNRTLLDKLAVEMLRDLEQLEKEQPGRPWIRFRKLL